MAKILFINPPSRHTVYLKTNVRAGTPSYPNLTIATLAGHLMKDNIVQAIDLDLFHDYEGRLFSTLKDFKPDILAISAKTPDYLISLEILKKVKKDFPGIMLIIGGVHVTAIPQDAINEGIFDIIVIGEGDTVLTEVLSSTSLKDVPGIIFREKASGEYITTKTREKSTSLDNLPFPEWSLFDIKQYKNSRISSRQNPVALTETSRGCAFTCNFCNKLTFGTHFRAKSPERVIEEFRYILKCGFKEIHIIDDSFTQDIKRAKLICELIIRHNLKFPWSMFNGIRANMVDEEFLSLAKRAGCWQIGFGIETGDENVLKSINKKISLEQVERGIRLVAKSGIETFGFFIFGLSGETEESMKRTIEFAKNLPLSIAKFDICIPYPGTQYYQQLKAEGRIKTEDWSKYICHNSDDPLFDHPNLKWETIERYYKSGFREFYLRPSYIIQRIIRSIRKGDLFYDIKYFFNSDF